jgi:hypothetical protein
MYQYTPTCPKDFAPHNRLRGLFNATPDGEIRHDLVARVRREIAAGTYETPEKWQEALDRLADDLK